MLFSLEKNYAPGVAKSRNKLMQFMLLEIMHDNNADI